MEIFTCSYKISLRCSSFLKHFMEQEDNNTSSKLRVWVADIETGYARPLFQSPDIYLNAVFDK